MSMNEIPVREVIYMFEAYGLHKMFKDANIEHDFRRFHDGYQVRIFSKDKSKQLCDAVIHSFSYGNEKGLFEIQGAVTKQEEENDCKDGIKGYLTAEEVFKRFKYCYENETDVYAEGNE